MNVFIAQKVVSAVQELLNGNIPNHSHGICHNVRQLCGDTYYYDHALFCLGDVAELWPKFSGDSCYPVPDPYGGDPNPEWAYHDTIDEWEEGTAYTALRLELCHFIVDYLKRYYNLK